MPKIIFYGRIVNYKDNIKYNQKILDFYKEKNLITEMQNKKLFHNLKYTEEASKHTSFFLKKGENLFGIPICTVFNKLKGTNSIYNIKENNKEGDTKNIEIYYYEEEPKNIKILKVINNYGNNIKVESLENNEDAIIGRFKNYDNFIKFKNFIINLDEKNLTEENITYYFELDCSLEDLYFYNVEKGLVEKNLKDIKNKNILNTIREGNKEL